MGTWTEAYDVIKETPSNYVHCFFELGDGSALAFFQFEEGMREDPMPMPRDPYEHHVALGVDSIETVDYFRKRIEDAGCQVMMVDHGYCYSCYTHDPNGMVIEVSTIVPNGIGILEQAARTSRRDSPACTSRTTAGAERRRSEALALRRAGSKRSRTNKWERRETGKE